MFTKEIREKVNACLQSTIVRARESTGLSTREAAELAGVSEIELLTVETLPWIVSINVLNKIMASYGKEFELMEAMNRTTALIFENKINRRKDDLPRLIDPLTNLNSPPPAH